MAYQSLSHLGRDSIYTNRYERRIFFKAERMILEIKILARRDIIVAGMESLVCHKATNNSTGDSVFDHACNNTTTLIEDAEFQFV